MMLKVDSTDIEILLVCYQNWIFPTKTNLSNFLYQKLYYRKMISTTNFDCVFVGPIFLGLG